MEHSIINLEGGSQIYYTIKNGRMIELSTNAINVEELTEFNLIKGITIGKTTINVGDNFKHDLDGLPSTYHITRIEKGGDPDTKYRHKYTLLSHPRNKTTTYILPCLDRDKEFFQVDTYLINSYLNKERDQLYLLYRFAKTPKYATLEQSIIKHPNFVSIDNSIEGFDLFLMDIPNTYWNDVEEFIYGKYSKISKNLREKIKKFYKLHDKSRIWQILTRDAELVKYMEKEYFCSFKGIDLEERPKLEEEIWKVTE